MHREQFDDWGKSLSEPDFWRAVSILGASQFDVNLASEHAAGRHLRWKYPEPLPPNLSVEHCLDLWGKLRSVRPLRLALTSFYDNQAEINAKFLAYAAASLYLNVPFESPGLLWRWPLRFGFLTDPISLETRANLVVERERHESLKNLTDISTVEEKNAFEFLVIPAPIEQARELLFQSPVTVRAHCLVVFSEVFSEWEKSLSHAGRLVSYTNSAGALFRPGSFSPRDWFREFVWNLSHDLSIDEADPAGVLLANSDLLEQARISRFLNEVANRLIKAGGRDIPVSGTLADELQLSPGSVRSGTVGYELRNRLLQSPQSIFDRERRGATWSVQLDRLSRGGIEELAGRRPTRAAPPSLPPPPAPPVSIETGDSGETAAAPPLSFDFEDFAATRVAPSPKSAGTEAEDQPSGRFLQASIPEPLRSNLITTITVFIDAPRAGAVVADKVFPDELLPEEEEGHLLTVVFSEPKLLTKPLVETLYLPRTGASTAASFDIATGPDFTALEARITVLYENRILQTSLLRGPTGEIPTLRVEMNVRPGLRGLDRQRRFDAAMVLNHSATGVPTATAGAGYNFATFSLQGLDKTIEQIEGRINGTLWADDEYKTLDAQGSEELLRFLARRGATLYREFLRYVPDPERLRNATHIQVVAREHASRLPVEFFYTRTPPLPDAKLCNNWRTALEKGMCAQDCQDAESVVCPLGFWCLSRVLEWHRFDINTANQTEGRAFALRDAKPGQREKSLPELKSAVMAASARVDNVVKDSLQAVRGTLQKRFGSEFAEASGWKQWAAQVQAHSPSILLLIPHTEEDADQLPTMEINNDELASENLKREHVLGPKGDPQPIVLLLGCNTDNKGLPHETFVPYFADWQAAIIVSSISKVLGRHAAPLACDFIERLLALPRQGNRSFGEVLRELRCRSLLDGPPIALVLKAYGDADWRI